MEVSSANVELENALAKVSKRTNSYLKAAAKFAVQNNLPLCLASAWSSRAKNDNIVAGRPTDPASCIICGLDLRNKRCFDVQINEIDAVKNLQGICCGCRQVYKCGEVQLPSCSELVKNSGSVTDDSSILDRTFDEDSICAASTPNGKGKVMPLISPRVTNLQNQAKKNRKRRGSALERLLKEEDSETDRSLSGFLNMVAKY
ncbi:hypothetical protein ANCCAN_15799 [Ancylostoma caninum]|uniref:Uncharacterized protein n=1 Tax=Ancylostoma caninum TaxID=29170 RepID=A0A368G1P0_ANCCA|nr:hypothetical protein ANCCAN_15799 [Ancylostoma caninum]